MNETKIETAGRDVPRIRLYGQPVGLGIPLTFAGGVLTVIMILALDPKEHWILQLVTVAMAIGFGCMLLLGLSFLLQPLEKVRISRDEIQLRLGPIVLRRIDTADIRSVGATSREVTVKKQDCDLYRILVHCSGKWPNNRTLWMDWALETEEALRRNLPDSNFLM